ncbi:MAG: nucleotide-binding protein [Verrucomicrobia bacterium]|nr:nucleotide-binding protein [Verrucomicrobiota bacterium]
MSNSRPSIFIGSSKEGLPIAEAIQLGLDHDCQVTIWSQGVFGLSRGTLETLAEAVNRFDFAILILTPDDLTLSRDQATPSPRDNVVMELGMFIGAIGRRRSFIVHDRTKEIKLPTDLAGITPATFAPHDDNNLIAAVGPVCTQLKQAVKELGIRSRSELTGIVDPNEQFLIVADLLGEPANQFFIQMFELNCTFSKGGSHWEPVEFYEWANNQSNTGGTGGFRMETLCKQLPDANLLQIDLKNNLSLTERGKAFASWLVKNGRKAEYFWSQKGTWGVRPDWMKQTAIKEKFSAMNTPTKTITQL